ncbi:MAG: glycosyltransferase [Hyphomonadaceae bacterium]|nr:glycosyltransferase [Hyphomonadaceae bacterium]
MRFSIIVPAYNLGALLEHAVESALAQATDAAFEVLVVDDCSTDDTWRIAQALGARDARVQVHRTPANGGPGAARNVGLAHARGEWVVFLDGDDALAEGALAEIAAAIDAAPLADLVAYDWRFQDGTGGRKDFASLAKPKAELIREALALQTDGSVIFTAMRTALLRAHGMAFQDGLHEDVDFIFEAYCAARRIAMAGAPLYIKTARAGSIVLSASERHIDGFVRAFAAMGETLDKYFAKLGGERRAFADAHAQGWVALVATRVRALRRLDLAPARAGDILRRLRAALISHGVDLDAAPLPVRTTKYFKLAERFIAGALDERHVRDLFAYVDALEGLSYSCADLHHSAFLRGDQVRTCCKRFFVDGEMRGDMVLLDAGSAFSAQSILGAKRSLHAKINRGESSGCEGCPFLELKAWSPLEKLDIRYLSLEHHSVCNLKCAYCSEEYHGGARAQYDVRALVEELCEEGALDQCDGIVWGGGEPTLDAAFAPLAQALAERRPHVKQRILTNAVARNSTVEDLLSRDRASVVTSVDAGSARVFKTVRGKDRLKRVLGNLQRMAAVRAENVTVKYIFTDDNARIDEALSFAALAQEHALMGCNFQLSADFKKEGVAREALAAMAALHCALEQSGARLVFVDDLARQRLFGLPDEERAHLAESLAGCGLADALAEAQAYERVAIWGAGWQAKFLLERARFFDTVEAPFFVDATPTKIGGRYLDREVRAPAALRDDAAIPVVIAAAQGTPAIYQAFLDLGLDRSRLVRGLIL